MLIKDNYSVSARMEQNKTSEQPRCSRLAYVLLVLSGGQDGCLVQTIARVRTVCIPGKVGLIEFARWGSPSRELSMDRASHNKR